MEAIIVYFIILLSISSLVKWFKRTQSKSSGGPQAPARRPSGSVPQRPVRSVSQAPDERRERPISIAERIREEIERAAMERMQPQGQILESAAPKPIQQKPKAPVREAILKKPKPVPSPAPRKNVIVLSPFALRFDPRSVRQGFIFSEILGPPRAERF